jgi:hypothetical protein
MEKMYIKQHKRMAMGEKLTGQSLGGKGEAAMGSKGKKGDPKHTPAMMSKGKKNA